MTMSTAVTPDLIVALTEETLFVYLQHGFRKTCVESKIFDNINRNPIIYFPSSKHPGT